VALAGSGRIDENGGGPGVATKALTTRGIEAETAAKRRCAALRLINAVEIVEAGRSAGRIQTLPIGPSSSDHYLGRACNQAQWPRSARQWREASRRSR
jgi:hypothetical protein